MIPQGTKGSGATRAQVREAAVWMALLRSPDRTERTERGFRRWIAEHESHTAAFEIVSSAWESTGGLSPGPLPHAARSQRAGFRRGALQTALVAAALGIAAVIGIFWYQRAAGVATDIGEQRTLTLADGSRVLLNTNSRVVVRFEPHRRLVELKQGEALFEVARKAPDNPFVVQAGAQTITALGTRFVVRRDALNASITLIEGRIAVTGAGPDNRSQRAEATEPRPVILSPGERVTVFETGPAKLDMPPIEKVTAWRSGHVDLVDVSLADAAAEMNRYSRTQLLIEQPAAAALRVSGVFRTGDIESFANAIAETYGLRVTAQDGSVLLEGRPNKVRSHAK